MKGEKGVLRLKDLTEKINLPARASIGYLSASLVGKAIGLLTTPFFTRLISEEEYGGLTLYLTVLGVASVICSAFSSSSAVYGGLSHFSDDEGSFLKSAILISTAFSLTICLLLFASWSFIGLSKVFIIPMSLQIVCDSIVGVSMARARYKYRYFEVMLISLLTSALPALLSIPAIFRIGRAAVRIYLMLVVSLAVASVQLYRILRSKGRISKSAARNLLCSALPMLPHCISVSLSAQADKLFVTGIMGAAALAKYSVVHSLGIALQFVVSGIGSALGPWIIRRLDRGEGERVKGVVEILFALLCALSLGLCAISPTAMRLLAPSKYLEALPALFPIAISTPLALISFVLTLSLIHTGKGKYTASLSLINLALCVTLNYTLITPLGYFGAGLALLICQIITVMLGFAFLKSSGTLDIVPFARLCGCFAFSLLIGAITNIFDGNILPRLIMLTIPAIWGFSVILKCRKIVFEDNILPQKE